ncbi:MAG: iron uptake porin [Spirulinaceae cyanobacterium]
MLNLDRGLLIIFSASLLFTPPLAAQEVDRPADPTLAPTLIEAENQPPNQTLDQGVGASQFSDVDLSDWAFQALDDLMRRYNCLAGYPNGTFRGDEPVSRYEFAAGLNACLQQVEVLLQESTADAATTSDLDDLTQRLQNLQSQLDGLEGEVDEMDDRSSNAEGSNTTLETEIQVNTASSDSIDLEVER